jgi:hypothetical protein
MKFLVLLLALCVIPAFSEEESDVRSLLNEANAALDSPVDKPKPAPAAHRRKPEKKLRDESDPPNNIESESADQKTPAAIALPPARLVPLDSPDLNEILSVDIRAKKQESTNAYPRSVVRLTAGANWLGNGYGLIQDDDTFSHIGGSALTGLHLEYNPAFLLPFLDGPNTSLSLSLAFGAGYFRGQGLMRRTGVQTGDQIYDLSTFPVSVELGPVFSLWRKVGIQVCYGMGVEFVHQSGDSQWNTVTNMFWGDTVSVAVRGYLSDTIEAYAGWQYRGFLVGSTPRVTGSMLTAGIGFEFAN